MIGSPEDRKRTIARATCRAIVEHGLHQMNMRDIARALGTTTGPLQHYFASKEDLLLYTKNLLIDELLSDARRAGSRAAKEERLQVVCEELLPFSPSARQAWLVLTAFNGRAIGDAQLTAIQNSRYSKCRKAFEEEIVLAMQAGVLDASLDPVLEAMALASFVFGLAVQVLFLSPGEMRRAKALVPRYLERTFGTRSGGGRPRGRRASQPALGARLSKASRPRRSRTAT